MTWPVKNKTAIAVFFAVNPSTIDKWRARGMPGSPGKWDVAEIARWRLKRLEELRKAAEEGDPDRRLKKLKAGMLRLQLDAARKKYIRTTDHLDFVQLLAKNIRDRLLSLAGSLAGQIRGQDYQTQDRAIKDRIWEILQDLSDHAGGEEQMRTEKTKRA